MRTKKFLMDKLVFIAKKYKAKSMDLNYLQQVAIETAEELMANFKLTKSELEDVRTVMIDYIEIDLGIVREITE